MIDVKKLITGFLILAVAAVCSGLIFSLVNLSPAATTNADDGITIGGGGSAVDSGNAFLPTEAQVQEVAAALAPGLASSTMLVSSTDPSNLTDNLAAQFVNGVVTANPSGPTTDADGNPTFAAPDVNTLAANVADTTTTQNLQIPDWTVEAEAIPITIVATSSASALSAYVGAANDILDSHLDATNTQVQNIVNNESNSASASDITYVESQTQSALQDVASLKVPSAAVAYQKSLLAELVYEKNMARLNELAQTDPVKASLIFQQEDPKFISVETDFLNQGTAFATVNLSLKKTSANSLNPFLSFFQETFGVSQALALDAVATPDADANIAAQNAANQAAYQQLFGAQTHANVVLQATQGSDTAQSTSLLSLISSIHLQNEGEKLEALLKNTLLQILKNTLVAIIQREVLTWIQGSGAPKFITNWGTQLVNAAQTSAINSINSLFDQNGCTFPAFIGQEKIILNAFYKPGSNACANQFAAALGSNSFQQFYNNFKNGGFVAFGASTLPSGNPYGSLFFNAQTVAFSYSNQQAASKAQTQTSQGLKSSLVCSDGSNPGGTHTECESNTAQDYPISAGESCNSGFTPVTEDNGNLCANGTQPQVTTPAAATGFVLGSGIDATPKQLAAANDITGVLNAVLNSLLTGLASAAVNAAGQFVNQSLTSLNASSITAAASTTTPAAIPLACNPTSQTVPGPQTISTPGFTNSASSTSSNASSTSTTPTSTSPTSLSATGGTLDVNDNPPIYYWSDDNGVTSTGAFFSDVFSNPGTYNVYLTDSTGDATSTCTVTVSQ